MSNARLGAATLPCAIALALGGTLGVGGALGIALSPLWFILAAAGAATLAWRLFNGAGLKSGGSQREIKVPLALIDNAFRGSLDQAFEIGEGIKEHSEVGVLQVSESVARIYTDLGNHVREIESLRTRMNDEELDNSLASVVSQQRNFLDTVPDVLKDIERRTQALSETAVEAQGHTSHILALVADICKITKSSKLLAVNALVEAAHAGSRGKGFAVVATTMREVADQVATFSDSIAEIGEAMANILPQMATVSDEISQTCAEHASHMTGRVGTLTAVYDATRADLLELMAGLQSGGDNVRVNANQILMDLQFQDRLRQELERMQARTRVPLQVLLSLSNEIESGSLEENQCQARIRSLVEEAKNDLRLETTHSEGSEWGHETSGDVEMF